METMRLKKKKMSRSQFIVQFLSQRVVSGRKKNSKFMRVYTFITHNLLCEKS